MRFWFSGGFKYQPTNHSPARQPAWASFIAACLTVIGRVYIGYKRDRINTVLDLRKQVNIVRQVYFILVINYGRSSPDDPWGHTVLFLWGTNTLASLGQEVALFGPQIPYL